MSTVTFLPIALKPQHHFEFEYNILKANEM